MSESNTIIHELNTFVQTYAARSEFIKTTTAQKINATQAHLLMLLQEENATNANLANKMNLSKPAITKAVKNLIAHGYVISSQDASDKRSVNYALTPAGIKLRANMNSRIKPYTKTLMPRLRLLHPNNKPPLFTFSNKLIN